MKWQEKILGNRQMKFPGCRCWFNCWLSFRNKLFTLSEGKKLFLLAEARCKPKRFQRMPASFDNVFEKQMTGAGWPQQVSTSWRKTLEKLFSLQGWVAQPTCYCYEEMQWLREDLLENLPIFLETSWRRHGVSWIVLERLMQVCLLTVPWTLENVLPLHKWWMTTIC